MKFLCLECDERMDFDERAVPGDGTFAAAFTCPTCGRRVAMLANPMETQLVESLGVKIGGRTLDEQPLELVRSRMVGREDAFEEDEGGPQQGGPQQGGPRQGGPQQGGPRQGGPIRWSAEAEERLQRVPKFVRGMVKKIYGEYAAERGIAVMTPELMDRARTELGLEGM